MLFGPFSMFNNFYQLYLHNETCVALVNLKHEKKSDENQIFLDLIIVIENRCLLIPLVEYIGPSNCVHY